MRWIMLATLLALLPLAAARAKIAPNKQGAVLAKKPWLPSPMVIIHPRRGFLLRPCPERDCRRAQTTVRKQRGSYDFAGLKAALVKLRGRYQRQRALTLVPSSRVSWDVVLRSVAALRRDAAGRPLFPVVFFADYGD